MLNYSFKQHNTRYNLKQLRGIIFNIYLTTVYTFYNHTLYIPIYPHVAHVHTPPSMSHYVCCFWCPLSTKAVLFLMLLPFISTGSWLSQPWWQALSITRWKQPIFSPMVLIVCALTLVVHFCKNIRCNNNFTTHSEGYFIAFMLPSFKCAHIFDRTAQGLTG